MYAHARYYRLYIKGLHKSYKSVQRQEGRKAGRAKSAAHLNI